jgi:hypothetical protein
MFTFARCAFRGPRTCRLATALLIALAMNDSRLVLCLIALTACSDSAGEQPDGGDNSPPACAPSTATTTVNVTSAPSGSGTIIRPWEIDAMIDGTSLLAHRRDADDAMQMAMIDGAGGLVELARLPDSGAYDFKAAVVGASPDSSVCTVSISSKAGLTYACSGRAAENAGIDSIAAEKPPVPFRRANGALSIFTQTHYAFTEIQRDASGAWKEIEQYQSSISYPTDVAAPGGMPIVCFIASGGRAVLQSGDSELTSAETTRTCHIAVDGLTLHVLTDGGYTTMPLGNISSGGTFEVTPVTALANQRITDLFVADGVAYVLGSDTNGILATRLPEGTAIPLGTSADRSAWDAGRKAIYAASSKLMTSGSGPTYPQTITFETRCLP